MKPPVIPIMHQFFDDDLPFQANRALPPALRLRQHGVLRITRPWPRPPAGAVPGLARKHYSRVQTVRLESRKSLPSLSPVESRIPS